MAADFLIIIHHPKIKLISPSNYCLYIGQGSKLPKPFKIYLPSWPYPIADPYVAAKPLLCITHILIRT